MTNSGQERREETSADTVATPEDFSKEYDYGSGRIRDWSREDMLKKMPKPKENNTILNTSLDPTETPDELDKIPARASAAGMIYSFYGRSFLQSV